MAAVAGQIRFYVDESALGLGKALAFARKDTIHVGHPLILPQCSLGVLDPDWIPEAAARGLIVICRDKRIRTKPGELLEMKKAGLRTFCLGGKRDQSTWDWLTRVVRLWDQIEEIVRTRPEGRWFYLINQNDLTELIV
ncbi:hypothetical protein [Nocardia sp. NPDC057455]|uniref:PIN-like domain-containing protein n=1 Tax=Nocardia sp. NPDC057455 TaxID=3346138 RepID=UPI00366E7006